MYRYLKFVVPFFLFSCSFAQDYNDLIARSEEDIRNEWQWLGAEEEIDATYEKIPVWNESPYTEGEPDVISKNAALKQIRFIRYLAGLNNFVSFDYSLTRKAQMGALLLKTSDFSHFPVKPEGMNDVFYSSAGESVKTSSLCRGWTSLSAAVRDGVIRCDSLDHLFTVSHRRWLLNPSLRRVGVGYIDGMSVFTLKDQSGLSSSFEMVAWPAPGCFPREYFNADDPWSISFSSDFYQLPDENIEVTIFRKSDDMSWVLNRSFNDPSNNEGLFSVDTSPYGIENVLVFRPPVSQLQEKESTQIIKGEYSVLINGIKNFSGQKGSLTYKVTFFDLSDQVAPLEANQTGDVEMFQLY